ncbi:unnamed protein product [Phytophthora lilii]|uniref:Unnamed protein product n=1 Tax=Phytophthora lilii TaxID=2077276 RepID=A0A9W6UDA3_9STRA|nr:unnamed protein product [Phytophthora lilii]
MDFDDILVFARSPVEVLDKLRAFFIILWQRNLKLNARKCELFSKKVIWCGKVIDGDGIEHDPSRLQALINMPLPPTAAALQHFLCAINWLRESMVDYARTVAPLQQKLEEVMAARGRRKSRLAGVDLTWTNDDESTFRVVLELLSNSSKLFFPDRDAHVCLFSDASASGWAVVLTQVREWSVDSPVEQQHHEMLVCRGGTFTKSQINWSVVEKEGYPIARACGDLEFSRLGAKSNSTSKASFNAGLCGLRVVATQSNIAGEHNLWANIVSRWGQPPAEPTMTSTTVHHVTTRSESTVSQLRPLEDEAFKWPTMSEIKAVQARCKKEMPPTATVEDGLATVSGKVWIPSTAQALLLRLFIVAHCGIQAHRGEHVMTEQLGTRFYIKRLTARVAKFIRECLLCKHVKGGKIIQRAWTTDREVSKRNERLHMDYLFLGETYGTTKYVLVLKDELTHFCELIPADSANSEVVVASILDWFKRFGLPESWESNNGSHFKSEVMASLCERLKAQQAFVPVYTPWINGTVKRLNRDILQVLRAMLLDF